jgi:hypothetical protein
MDPIHPIGPRDPRTAPVDAVSPVLRRERDRDEDAARDDRERRRPGHGARTDDDHSPEPRDEGDLRPQARDADVFTRGPRPAEGPAGEDGPAGPVDGRLDVRA